MEGSGARVGVHVHGGGRRLRECRGRETGAWRRPRSKPGAPAAAQGEGEPGRGRPRLEVMGGSAFRVSGSMHPGQRLRYRVELTMQLSRGPRGGRGGRVTEGDGVAAAAAAAAAPARLPSRSAGGSPGRSTCASPSRAAGGDGDELQREG